VSGLVGNEMDDATARKVANERAAFFVDKKVVKARVRCIAGMSALVLEFDSGDVVEIAVQQAGEHEPDWNFETYLKVHRGMAETGVDAFFGFEMAAKFKFLDETHDFLDHGMDNGKYHCRVFSGALRIRMKHLYQALGDRGLYFL